MYNLMGFTKRKMHYKTMERGVQYDKMRNQTKFIEGPMLVA